MSEQIGRYEIVREIGAGSTATVYLGRDRDELVALKVLHPHFSEDPVVKERLRREVEISRTLEHPGIVRIYDFVSWGRSDVVVMEYCEGGSLAERKPDLPEEWVRIAHETAEALAYAHARGVIHRDIKPRNILFDREGRVKLCDFGSAHVKNLIGITTSTMFIGTPQFVPPESLSGATPDPRWDLYSLGAVLYQIATGRSHTGQSFASLFRGQAKIVPPRELNPAVPEWLDRLIVSLLGPLESRPSGARALARTLERRSLPRTVGTKECLFCRAPMPIDTTVCLTCGRREPDLTRYDGFDAESIVLSKVPEQAGAIENLLRVLRAISGNPDLTFSFITEDVRMYSKAERKEAVTLPVRLLDHLRPETVDRLIPVLQGSGLVKVSITRYPVGKALRKMKKGPLVRPDPVTRGAGVGGSAEAAGAAFLVQFAGRSGRPDPAAAETVGPDPGRIEAERATDGTARGPDPGRIEAGRRGVLASVIHTAYRLVRDSEDPALADDLTRLTRRLESVLSRLAVLERNLEAVSLGEIYADIQRLEARITHTQDVEETARLTEALAERRLTYERYLEQERLHAELTARTLEAVHAIEELGSMELRGAGYSSKEELRRIMAELTEIGRTAGSPTAP